MLLWLLSACFFANPEGGQQGEDLFPDDTAPEDGVDTDGAVDNDDTASVDSGEAPYTGTLELSLDGAPCVGTISLDAAGDGDGSCTTDAGLALELAFDGTRDGDNLSGTTQPDGTFQGTYAGDLVEGTVQGAADGRTWGGVFSATR